MAKFFSEISEQLQQFIAAQQMFFVASAPLTADGHVNLSPKGLDSFRVLSSTQVAYLDLTGSGNETSAHLRENGRITLMFCAFQGAPNILRLYGKGATILPGDPDWENLRALFGEFPGVRQIIVADIELVQTSCGYAVPLYDYLGQRDTLNRWAENRGPERLIDYRREKNACSLDGIESPLGERLQMLADSEP